MIANCANTTKIEKVLEENCFFVISESKVIFKNHQAVISLNQISNIRLIKTRDFTGNIIVLMFSLLFYLMILPSLNFNTIFQSLILALVIISLILVSCIENYSYKLLINKTDYDFNEIIVSEENLHFAKIFLSKFHVFSILRTKVKEEFVFDYQDLKKDIA